MSASWVLLLLAAAQTVLGITSYGETSRYYYVCAAVFLTGSIVSHSIERLADKLCHRDSLGGRA